MRRYTRPAALAVLGMLTFTPVALGQTLEWAISAGGINSDAGLGIATTERGDSYVTGWSDGGFVAKYDRHGALLWKTSVEASSVLFDFFPGERYGIATDERGDSHVTGLFEGTATFGQGEPNETTLTHAGSGDIFVAKYDRDGALLWATSAGGTSSDVGLSIATTERGDSYVTGWFEGTATFGQGEPNETTLTPAGSNDIFIAKYDRDGALLWATSAGGTSFDQGLGIATDARGDSYITGSFHGTATFGQGEPNETTLTSGHSFIAKYDRDGALLWATSARGGSQSIATTARGDSYVTGSGIFVAKYDRDGALLWATSAGVSGFGKALGIATTERGDSYITGYFIGTATFGQGEPNETTLTSEPGDVPRAEGDFFVAKYRSELPLSNRGRGKKVLKPVKR